MMKSNPPVALVRLLRRRHSAGVGRHFHFDYEDPRVRIASRREKSASVMILPKEKQNILVRIPRWAPTKRR